MGTVLQAERRTKTNFLFLVSYIVDVLKLCLGYHVNAVWVNHMGWCVHR